jgi:hypothetical protein
MKKISLQKFVIFSACLFAPYCNAAQEQEKNIILFSAGENSMYVVAEKSNDKNNTFAVYVKKSWHKAETHQQKNYFSLKNNVWKESYGLYFISNSIKNSVSAYEDKTNEALNAKILHYLSTLNWGKHYIKFIDEKMVFSDVSIQAYSDLNKNGLTEYWLSYKTMYGQYGGFGLEDLNNSSGDFTVIFSDCPDCGD